MIASEEYVGYPMRYKLAPVMAAMLFVFFAVVGAYLWWETLVRLLAHRLDYVLLACHMLLAFAAVPLLAWLSLSLTRQMWYFLYRYSYDGLFLHAFDPVLRKGQSIRLCAVTEVREFTVPAGPVGDPARNGYLLRENNNCLRISEVLPLWSLIQEQCQSAQWQHAPKPWWAGNA